MIMADRYIIGGLEDIASTSFLAQVAVEILRSEMTYDVVHDEAHIVRVVKRALRYAERNGDTGDQECIIIGAVLHDLVNVPKNSPDRSKASIMSADKSLRLLEQRVGLDRSDPRADKIYNIIAAHSWSANIEPTSHEAMAVQDADRMESLGVLGLARMFAGGGSYGRPLFHPLDPFAQDREPDDQMFSLDHYYVKLDKLPETMRTIKGRQDALRLHLRMKAFMEDLKEELA
jgi:uncharacterized protein